MNTLYTLKTFWESVCCMDLDLDGRAVPEKFLFTELLNSWEHFLALHHCHSLCFTISPVLLRKFQTEWPLFGCFLAYRVNNTWRVIYVCKSFFTGGIIAALGITQKAPCHKVRMKSTFLPLHTHLPWFACCICVIDAGLTFSHRDKLPDMPPTSGPLKSHIKQCQAVCSTCTSDR